MKTALVIVLVVAIVGVLFYVARSKADSLPEPEPMPPAPPPAPTMSIRRQPLPTTGFVLERTAEEVWRARVMLAAQDYARAANEYATRRAAQVASALSPTPAAHADVDRARRAAFAADAIAAAAALSSRTQLIARIAFATRPPAGAGAAQRAWDALGEAVRMPIEFRPELPPVMVATGIIPIGELQA